MTSEIYVMMIDDDLQDTDCSKGDFSYVKIVT